MDPRHFNGDTTWYTADVKGQSWREDVSTFFRVRWSSGRGWDEASLCFLQVKCLPTADNYEGDIVGDNALVLT